MSMHREYVPLPGGVRGVSGSCLELSVTLSGCIRVSVASSCPKAQSVPVLPSVLPPPLPRLGPLLLLNLVSPT
ncbi:hypothetical protein M0802_002284 [Mischocyttarus mexicanus]|nr:hypothetical protein M0802_002284 [Mischocyttarus mexicanus]